MSEAITQYLALYGLLCAVAHALVGLLWTVRYARLIWTGRRESE